MTKKALGSERFQLNSVDWLSIGKGLLIATIGAGLTYLTEEVAKIDFGDFTALVVAGWSVITNVVRKWIADYSK